MKTILLTGLFSATLWGGAGTAKVKTAPQGFCPCGGCCDTVK
jgi:hypothetical protein